MVLIVTRWCAVRVQKAGPCMVRRYRWMMDLIPSFLHSHIFGDLCLPSPVLVVMKHTYCQFNFMDCFRKFLQRHFRTFGILGPN